MELLRDAGAPDGTVNVIHGQHDCVNFICDHPDIRAISFVGGDPAGRHIYNRGSANGKRVQVLLRISNLTLTLDNNVFCSATWEPRTME